MEISKKYYPLLGVVVAIIASGFAGWFAVTISTDYYAIAPFHFDSASYRLQSVGTYRALSNIGFWSAFERIIHTKDGLDLLLRLAFAPKLLLGTYGHLGVLLPFMALFLWLLFTYVYSRTQSIFASSLCVSVIFTFQLIYDPYTGIADYWKDNIAVWLLGSAVLAWFRSDNLRYRKWTFLSGLLLGLLVMQRTALAVYAAFLFLPIFFWAFFQLTRREGTKITLLGFLPFLSPIVISGSFVGIFQWEILYNYYFVAAYDYATKSQLLNFLTSVAVDRFGYPQLVFFALIAVFLISTPIKTAQVQNIVIAGWIAIGLPLTVIATGTKYNIFFNVWTVLLVVSFSMIVAECAPFKKWQMNLLYASSIIIIISSCAQYTRSVDRSQKIAQNNANWRPFWEVLTDSIMAQPSPRNVSLLFGEVDVLFKNHLIFNRQIAVGPGQDLDFTGFLWVHDTYYKANKPGLSLSQLIEQNIKQIETTPGTLSISYCNPEDVMTCDQFAEDGKKVAVPFARAMSYHLLNSPNWQVIKTIASPYGSLCFYKYARKPL